MDLCKNCGDPIGYLFWTKVFTKRKIPYHLLHPYLCIGGNVFALFFYQITEKCNKPEGAEKLGEI